MKKVISYVFFYAFFCLLQFFFGKYLTVGGIFPNFILIAVVYLGFSRGRISAQTMGFCFGLTWDVFSTDVFGARTLMLTVIGYFSGMFNRQFDKDQIAAQVTAVFLASLVYWAGFSTVYFILPEGSRNYVPFAVTLPGTLKIVVTVLITPLVFWVLNFASVLKRRYL
ncbi:MAG: rod shape-determining protein MreD [Endomicrobia bacterium]|nr:rod shape-determining protein MreD [Endomicrobiia bacterium]MCL2799107.1 rod shape-determining protein MreD [Endomicrobiia bacterium]